MVNNHRDYMLEAFDLWIQEQSYAPQGKLLLDVGCQSDVFKKPLEERGFVWQGTDANPMTSDVIRARMEDMPGIPSETYDLIFVCHSFEHCERPIDALREMRRILKPGGWIFLGTPYPCKHHILEADVDHIFVLNTMQMCRLMVYTLWTNCSSRIYMGDIEQNHTIVTAGQRPL